MRTVDALIAARDFFVSNPHRWTTGAIAVERAEGNVCFCALGGISKVTGCVSDKGEFAQNVSISCVNGPTGVYDRHRDNYQPIGGLGRDTLNRFSADGIELAAAATAVKYANFAAAELFPNHSRADKVEHTGTLMSVNDSVGYDAVIKCFDLAIKRATRRHINGDKPRTQAVAQ